MRSIIRNSLFFAAAYAAWSASLLSPARACSPPFLTTHELDPAEEAADTTPPDAPALGELQIARQPALPACNDSGACDGTGLIILDVTAPADDRTAAASMGYVVELVGEVPNVFPPDEPVRVDEQGEISFYFNDRDQPLDFTLSVRAMDLAGNLGEAATIEVSHPGGTGCIDDGRPQPPDDREAGGCSATGASSPLALGAVILALGLAVRRRRAEQE
jgi:MYXO-CTERM domain-containing protein